MKMRRAMAIAAIVAATQGGCSADPLAIDASESRVSPNPSVADVPSAPDLEPSASHPKEAVDNAPRVDRDLKSIAARFVAYALGRSRTFAHATSVSVSIGGSPVGNINTITDTLSDRSIWVSCPRGWETYAAASCPVDLLGPIKSTDVNGAGLVFETDYTAVTCAPTRTGPIPSGVLVVIRPTPDFRTCATDFALTLGTERGVVRSIDLTLAAP